MNRKFWENLVSLYGVHILNYIVPLVTLPFLAHRLGPVHWGELAFAEAYASYISLFIEYGFGLSATRDLAQVRDDEAARSRLLAGVIGAQAFLTFCALALTLLLGYGLQVFAAYRPLLPFAFGLATLRAMSPVWYFQGIERMQSVAVITIISNVAAMAAMLVLVQSAADAWIPLALRAGAAFISAAIAYLIAYQDTRFRVPSVSYVWSALRTGWSLFLFKSAVSLYTTANVLLLGILARPSEVAWFAGAEKIAKAAAGGVTPITQAFYPRINYLLAKDRPHAKRAAQMSVLVTIGSGLALGIPAWVAAPWLVRLLLGSGFDKAVPVLRLLGLLPPLMAASNVLGIQWMLPLRMDRHFNAIILLAGLVNIALALVLVPAYAQMGMAVSVVVAEAIVTGAMIIVLRCRRLDPWSVQPQREAIAA